jgi:hypothetical protein
MDGSDEEQVSIFYYRMRRWLETTCMDQGSRAPAYGRVKLLVSSKKGEVSNCLALNTSSTLQISAKFTF